MGFALRHGLPAIFHTYLENSPVHQDWLVEYLKLNPSQHFIATGFDRNAANNRKFARLRIRLLESVERRAGRPLHIVFHTLLTGSITSSWPMPRFRSGFICWDVRS